MASLFGLGFLKGAATSGLDRLEKREEFERDRKKEELLAKVRLETAKDLANYEDLLASKKGSKEFSSPDYNSGKYTIRNSKGETVSERDLTQSEKDEYATGQRGDKLKLDKLESDIANVDRDNNRQERLANAQIGSYNASADSSRASAEATRKGMSGLDGDNRNESGSYNVGSEIMRAQEKVVASLISAGIPAEDVAKLAAESAANAKARNQGYNEATQYFLDGLRLLRQGVKTDEITGKSVYDQDAALQGINKKRAGLGLQGY